MRADIPANENERLEALRRYGILDTIPEPSFDDVALLASEICGTAIAAISLVDSDRQWFKSIIGLDARETSRDVAFCAHAILNPDESLIVEDATLDRRFEDNPLVLSDPKIRFYAGTPLVTPGGYAVGTLCVIDREPRTLLPGQRQALEVLGREVVKQLELRRAVRDLEHNVLELKKAEAVLERTRREQLELKDRFISHVSHELRSPLTAIYQFITLVRDGLAGEVSAEQAECLDIALRNAEELKRMIGDLVEVTRARTSQLTVDRRRVRIDAIVADVVESLGVKATGKGLVLSAVCGDGMPDAVGDPGRIRQVLVNLIENAIKFTPAGGSIAVSARVPGDEPQAVRITVEDSGCGLEPKQRDRVFEYMYQVGAGSEQARNGLGLGLYICRELVTRQGGRIWVESEPGRGSRFTFTLPTFALDRLIAPLLSPANVGRGSVAVLTVDVFEAASRESAVPTGTALNAAWDVVKSCVIPSMDCMLPRLGDDSRGDTFVLVAMADEQGADVLARRIEEQLQVNEATRDAGLEWKIRTKLLSLGDASESTATDQLASRIAGLIEERLADTALRRAA